MVQKLWGMTVFNHEDTIYRILEYIQSKKEETIVKNKTSRPVQEPWSRWAVDEIIGELKLNENCYADEIIREFINRMGKYAEFAEPERKSLYQTAQATAQDLYSCLFPISDTDGKETIPF
jgi:hypothetical protein